MFKYSYFHRSTSRPTTSKQKALSDMEKIVQRKKETEVDASPAKSSKSIGVVLKKNIVTKASTTKDIKNTNDSPKPTSKKNISLISSEYEENNVDESLTKSSKSVGTLLKNDFLPKASTSEDINITNDSPKPAFKTNISLISSEFVENYTDESLAKPSKSKGVVLKNDFLPKASTSEDINITKDSRIPASKPNISLISCEYGENDVDESLAKTSKSMGVVLKNNFLPKASMFKDINITKDSQIPASKANIPLIPCEYGENVVDESLAKTSKSMGVVLKNDFPPKASTSKDVNIAKDSLKSALKPNISLISYDYGSSSSNDEEDA